MPKKRYGPGPAPPVHPTTPVEADRWREQGRYMAKGAARTLIGVFVASWLIVGIITWVLINAALN